MAVSDSIRININSLEAELAEATNISECLIAATEHAGTDTPPWIFLLTRLIHRVDIAAQLVIENVNVDCFPILRDMEKVTTAKVSKS